MFAGFRILDAWLLIKVAQEGTPTVNRSIDRSIIRK